MVVDMVSVMDVIMGDQDTFHFWAVTIINQVTTFTLGGMAIVGGVIGHVVIIA